jgi:hypothetical protein
MADIISRAVSFFTVSLLQFRFIAWTGMVKEIATGVPNRQSPGFP